MKNSGIRMLLVDDDHDAASNLVRLLAKKFDASVETAGDVSAAREKLAGDPFDVIILDYQLPDGNGLDLLEEIAGAEDHPPVVMVTGHGDESIASEAFRLKASGYVVKDQRLSAMLPEAVSTALNEVALRVAVEDLKRSHGELEAIVQHRTARLVESNKELLAEIAERKRVEESLKTLSAQVQGQATMLDQILSSSPDYFFLFDGKGKFIYANSSAAGVLGFSQEEMEGRYWWDLGLPELEMKALDLQREVVLSSGELRAGRVRLPVPAGEREFEYILSPITSPGSAAEEVVATLRDITADDRMIEELEELAAGLEEKSGLLDLIPSSIMLRDFNDRILLWNAGAEKLYGWSGIEAVGRLSQGLLATEYPKPLGEIGFALLDAGRWEGALTRVSQEGSRLEVMSRWVLKLDAQGQPGAVLELDDVMGVQPPLS